MYVRTGFQRCFFFTSGAPPFHHHAPPSRVRSVFNLSRCTGPAKKVNRVEHLLAKILECGPYGSVNRAFTVVRHDAFDKYVPGTSVAVKLALCDFCCFAREKSFSILGRVAAGHPDLRRDRLSVLHFFLRTISHPSDRPPKPTSGSIL